MKVAWPKIVCIILLLSNTGCNIICAVNSTPDHGKIVEKKLYWSKKDPDRCDVITKTYNQNGVLIRYTHEKKHAFGCTGKTSTYYQLIKVFNPNGEIASLSIEFKNKSIYKTYH